MSNLPELFPTKQTDFIQPDANLPQDDPFAPLGGSGGNSVVPKDITAELDDVIKSSPDDDLYLGMSLEEASQLDGDDLEDYYRVQILNFLGDDLKTLSHDDIIKKIKKYQDKVKAQVTKTLPDTIDRLRKSINKLMKRHDISDAQKKTLETLKKNLSELKLSLHEMIGEELADVIEEVSGVHMRLDTELTVTNDMLDEDMKLLIIDATGTVDNITMDDEKIRNEGGEVFKDKNADGKLNFWDEVEFQKQQKALEVSKNFILQADVEVELKHYDEESDTMTMTWKYKGELIEVEAKGWSQMRFNLTHESNVNAEKLAQWKEQFSEKALDSLYIGTDDKSVSARMFIENTPIEEQLAYIPGYQKLQDDDFIADLANKFADGLEPEEQTNLLQTFIPHYKAILEEIFSEYNKEEGEPTDINALWDGIFEKYLNDDVVSPEGKRDIMSMVMIGLWKENKELIPVIFNDNLRRIEQLFTDSADPADMAMVLFIEYKMSSLIEGGTMYGGPGALEGYLLNPTAGPGNSLWAWYDENLPDDGGDSDNTRVAISENYQRILSFLNLAPGFNIQVILDRLDHPELSNPEPEDEEQPAA